MYFSNFKATMEFPSYRSMYISSHMDSICGCCGLRLGSLRLMHFPGDLRASGIHFIDSEHTVLVEIKEANSKS